MSKVELKLDWCSHEAAKYAVEKWHYSQSMPTPPVIRIGAWEGGKYIGAVLFSRGTSDSMGSPYGLAMTQVCELTRVALSRHETPVSRIVAIALKLLARKEKGLQLIVSYADPEQNHAGGIYQAMNWVYVGRTASDAKFRDKQGRIWHSRQVSATGYKKQYGEYRRVPKISECERIPVAGKHKYLYPLDDDMRTRIQPLAQPYPKREPTT